VVNETTRQEKDTMKRAIVITVGSPKESLGAMKLSRWHAGGDPLQRYSFAQRLMRYGATYGRLAVNHLSGRG